MKRMATAVLTVLVALTLVFAASVAEAELRSESWACFARGYILDLNAVRVTSPVQLRFQWWIQQQPPLAAAETIYSFNLYDITVDEWGGMYLGYLIHVTNVDEGFASMLAKAANGEVAVELASYGGKCPADGRPLQGVDMIRLLDYDLKPIVPPTEVRG